MVTHDQEEALTMADRIVVMNHGVIDQIGSPLEVYRQPRTPFVADFVGQMNTLSGKLAAADRVEVGPLVFGLHGNGLPAGATVQLCFRPEDVQVRGINGGTPNVFEATVGEIEFHGSYCRAALAPAGDARLTLVAEFSINLMRDVAPETGRSLRIALPPDRLRLFARDPGQP
jgi:iron(III) transport system ATP-binding protein